jgi:hypothetical protein
MDWQKQLQEGQEYSKTSLYQNPGYQFERRNRKSIIIDVVDNDTSIGTTPLSTGGNEFT